MPRMTPAELPDDLPVRNNLVRTTYNNPDMHRGFASLSGRVHSASHLPSRIREIVVLSVAGRLKAEVELHPHRSAARNAGLTDAEIAAAEAGSASSFPVAAEAMAVEFAIAVDAAQVDDALWARARESFSEVELSDMAMLAGFYGLASRYVLAMGTDVDS